MPAHQKLRIMLELVPLNDAAVLGGVIIVLVFSVLRLLDEIVDVVVSLDETGLTEPPDTSESSNP